MAKGQVAARFVTEVAPPQLVSIMRRRHKAPRSLDTIAEDDDRELQQQLAYSDHHHQAATAAASLKRESPAPAARTGGFMRELSSCFSSNVVHGQAAGRGWEGRHKGYGGRRVVYAHQMHGN